MVTKPRRKAHSGLAVLSAALCLALLLAGRQAPAVADERPARLSGFSVATHETDDRIAKDTLVLRYGGHISYPMAEILDQLWKEQQGKYSRVVLELDSPGGDLVHAEAVIAMLAAIRAEATLTTQVAQGRSCLSACVLVFMQGEERIAGGATAWMFHGACPAFSNIPAPAATRRYLAHLERAGVATRFLCELEEAGYLDRPGRFWASGYELFHVHQANVITRLAEPWEPAKPAALPIDPNLRPR